MALPYDLLERVERGEPARAPWRRDGQLDAATVGCGGAAVQHVWAGYMWCAVLFGGLLLPCRLGAVGLLRPRRLLIQSHRLRRRDRQTNGPRTTPRAHRARGLGSVAGMLTAVTASLGAGKNDWCLAEVIAGRLRGARRAGGVETEAFGGLVAVEGLAGRAQGEERAAGVERARHLHAGLGGDVRIVESRGQAGLAGSFAAGWREVVRAAAAEQSLGPHWRSSVGQRAGPRRGSAPHAPVAAAIWYAHSSATINSIYTTDGVV